MSTQYNDEITMEFARQDDCLDKMTPSGLRMVVGERDRLRSATALQAERVGELEEALKLAQFGIEQMLESEPGANAFINALSALERINYTIKIAIARQALSATAREVGE
jgi:hypothetical protein